MALTGLRDSGRKDRLKSSKQKSEEKNQKKLEKKVGFYAKVKDTVTALGAKKTISKNKKKRLRRQKKLKAYDMSSLVDVLPDLDASNQNQAKETSTKLNWKSRQKILQSESLRLKEVLNKTTFQMDPIAEIQKHLESTQPPPDVSVVTKVKKKNRTGSSKRKSKAKKKETAEPSSNTQSYMDM